MTATSIFDQQQPKKTTSNRIRLKTMADLRKFAGRCLREAYEGHLSAAQARAISTLLDCARRLTEASGLEERVQKLEGRVSGSGVSEDDLKALDGRIQKQQAQVEEQAAVEMAEHFAGDGDADATNAHSDS